MSLNHYSKYAQLTDKQFQLIGKIVVEWANIEFLQKQLLSRLLFSSEFLSRTYTDVISAARIQDAIRESVSIHRVRYEACIIHDTVLKKIEQLNDEVAKVRTHRNKVAHFCWTRSTDMEIFGTNFSGGLPRGKKYNRSEALVTNSELEKLYTESYELVEALEKIICQIPIVDEDKLVKWIRAEQGGAIDTKNEGPKPRDKTEPYKQC
jgi:hypothetical protein